MLRHVYNPMLKRGVSKSMAMFIVFIFSSLGHEYIVFKYLLGKCINRSLFILGFFSYDSLNAYNFDLELY